MTTYIVFEAIEVKKLILAIITAECTSANALITKLRVVALPYQHKHRVIFPRNYNFYKNRNFCMGSSVTKIISKVKVDTSAVP